MENVVQKVNQSEELIAIPVKEYEYLKKIEGEYLTLLQNKKNEDQAKVFMNAQQMELRNIISKFGKPEMLPPLFTML